MRNWLVAGFVLVCGALSAAPSVTEVTARQRYPWNGMVDVSCTASGVVAGKNRTTVTATDLAAGTNVTVATLSVAGAAVENGAFSLAAGANQILWDAQKDLPKDYLSERMKIDVAVIPYSFSVKFNANGGTGTMANESFDYGTAKALTANTFTRSGYTFSGWATTASGAVAYTDKQSVSNLSATDKATVNLYAVWKGVLPVSSGLVAYYPFDGDSKDMSGKGRHLSGSGITWRSDHKGVSGKAASFPGGKALSYKGQLGCTNSMSFVCWVNPTANSDEYYPDYLWDLGDHVGLGRISAGLDWQAWPFIIAPTGSKGVGLAVGTKMVNVFQNAGYFDCLLSKYQTISGKWTHVAVTISSRGAPVLYVNGSKISASSTAFVESKIYVSSPFVVGGGNISHAGMWFKGGLDELAVYNRALSATEVKTLYDQTK